VKNVRQEVEIEVDITKTVLVGVTVVTGVMKMVVVFITTTVDCTIDGTVATVTVLSGVGMERHSQALETSAQANGKPEQLPAAIGVVFVVITFVLLEVVLIVPFVVTRRSTWCGDRPKALWTKFGQ
jgi:hypothetical protein